MLGICESTQQSEQERGGGILQSQETQVYLSLCQNGQKNQLTFRYSTWHDQRTGKITNARAWTNLS